MPVRKRSKRPLNLVHPANATLPKKLDHVGGRGRGHLSAKLLLGHEGLTRLFKGRLFRDQQGFSLVHRLEQCFHPQSLGLNLRFARLYRTLPTVQ